MITLKKVCVFCGTKSGNKIEYEEKARQLGFDIARNELELVFGAGGTGIMKAVAEGAKTGGGRVTGVTIQHLFDIEHPTLRKSNMDELKVYQRMFTRKVAMTVTSDAFCVLPGGLGTMDELFELMALKQLGLLNKPIIILDIDDFFHGLKSLLHQLIRDGFVKPKHVQTITFVQKVEDVIPTIRKELKKLVAKQKKKIKLIGIKKGEKVQ